MSRDEFEGELIIGVGNGVGDLFVKGNYESITVLQSKLLELEELRRENEELRKEILSLRLQLSQTDIDIPKPGFVEISCPNEVYKAEPWGGLKKFK